MIVRVAVREEAQIVHVSHDLLEHLEALLQQGKPAPATAFIVKAVTAFNTSRPRKEMKQYYKIAGRDSRGKVWKVRRLCVKVYAVQQPQARCTTCQTRGSDLRALPRPLLPPKVTHARMHARMHAHIYSRELCLHTGV